MKLEALTDDFIDSLVEDKPKFIRGAISLECECGWELDNGYCKNSDCSIDAPVEVFVCHHCGACEDPEHCVWGVQCPECCAPPHEHCLDDRGAKTGLHQERWNYAGRAW